MARNGENNGKRRVWGDFAFLIGNCKSLYLKRKVENNALEIRLMLSTNNGMRQVKGRRRIGGPFRLCKLATSK